MRQTVLADTGPLYAALDPDDRFHQRAQEEIRRLAAERLAVAVCTSTLLEGYSLVLYKLGLRVAHAWLAEVLTTSLLVHPAEDDYRQAQQLLVRFRDQPLSLFDAVLAVQSRRQDVPVRTYDHHFDVLRTAIWRP